MKIKNIEIKAKCNNQDKVRKILKSRNAKYIGTDHQIDTYFKIRKGRLKLRQGNIQNNLIYYNRTNKEEPKQSNITLIDYDPKSSLKEILIKALEVLVIVDKKREIYFIDNIKFHIDTVKDLGNFVEIEANDTEGNMSNDKLLKQCKSFLKILNISKEDLISHSYSDLLLKKNKQDKIEN